MKRVFEGTIVEVGRDEKKDGVWINVNGKDLFFGMTQPETKEFGPFLYRPVKVTIDIE